MPKMASEPAPSRVVGVSCFRGFISPGVRAGKEWVKDGGVVWKGASKQVDVGWRSSSTVGR